MLFKIKPLEWKDGVDFPWQAATPVGTLTIYFHSDPKYLPKLFAKIGRREHDLGRHSDIEAAKAAAEEWYRSRLLEALEPATMADIYEYERQDEACSGTPPTQAEE